MTPQAQKARELVQRYFDLNKSMTWEQAKQCAIIAVDEIIELLCADSSTVDEIEFTFYNKETSEYDNIKISQLIEYYKEVKQEIEKL